MNRIHNMRNRMLASAGMFLAVFLFAVTVPHVVPAQTIPETQPESTSAETQPSSEASTEVSTETGHEGIWRSFARRTGGEFVLPD